MWVHQILNSFSLESYLVMLLIIYDICPPVAIVYYFHVEIYSVSTLGTVSSLAQVVAVKYVKELPYK